jgi:hypothetical protein
MLPAFLLPVQLSAVIEQAKREARLMDKEIQLELGFKYAADWTRAKNGSRPLNFHRLCQASPAFLRALGRALIDAAREEAMPEAPGVEFDRDLIEDAIQMLERLKPRMLKAESVNNADAERKRA